MRAIRWRVPLHEHETAGGAPRTARDDGRARRRGRAAVRAPAGGGARGVPADAAPGHRRARRRRPARPAARERHLRGRAPYRGVADHDLVHRGHAPARHEAGRPGAVVPHRAGGGADRQAAGPVTGRRGIYHSAAPARGRRHHGHRDPLPAAGADPGPAPARPGGAVVLRAAARPRRRDRLGHRDDRATVTTAEEAAELDVPVHTPAFLFERVTRDEGGRPLEYVRSVYRGDRYRLELDLRPPNH